MSPNFAAMLDRIKREQAKRLLAAAVLLQAEHKRDLSRSNPFPHDNPSIPGEYPKGRTWNLRDSVAVEPTTVEGVMRNGWRVRVGYLKGAWYIEALRKIGRLTVVDTANRIRDRLQRIIRG